MKEKIKMNCTITDILGNEYYYEDVHIEMMDECINVIDENKAIIAKFYKRNIIAIERGIKE